MFEKSDNYIRINLDAILVVLILFFGLLMYNNSLNVNISSKSKPVTYIMAVSERTGITTPGIRLKIFQKEWISNKDNYNLLAFNRNPLSENNKTGIKVSQFQIIRQVTRQIPQFMIRYHLYPPEKDEPPILN
jgi:hypothetical protein